MSLKDVITVPEYTTVLSDGKKIKYRPFVVKEEKILLMAKESNSIEQVYDNIKKIIKNCIIEPEKINIDSLPYFDLQQLFILLRCKSMGESVQIKVTDPETKQSFETEMDLEKIKLIGNISKTPKVKINENLAIQYKYPSFSNFARLTTPNEESNPIDIVLDVASICIAKVFTSTETIDCSKLPKQEIIEFIDSLPKTDFEKFAEFFKNLPKLTYRNKFTNPVTGKTFDVEVDDFTNFFIL